MNSILAAPEFFPYGKHTYSMFEESRDRIRIAPFGINSEIEPIIAASELQKLKTSARPSILPEPRPRPLSRNYIQQLERER